MDASEWIEVGKLLRPLPYLLQKILHRRIPSMSATTQRPDMRRQPVNVRFAPQAAIQ